MVENWLEPPDYLGKNGKEVWFRFLPRLRRKEIFQKTSYSSFAALCAFYDRIRETQEKRKALARTPSESGREEERKLRDSEHRDILTFQGLASGLYFKVTWRDGEHVDLEFHDE